MLSTPSSALLLALLPPLASAAIQPYTLTIADKNESPDGVSRLAISVNNGVQGPLLTANKGDSLSVNVINKLTVGPPVLHKATAIHWHGLFQRGTQDEDGAAFIGQCPIISGRSYNYKFGLGTQTGTYWYHSHYSTQYCDGLRGPLVIYDPNDPLKNLYDIDNAGTVITLADWYGAPSLQSFPEGPVRPAGRPPIPVSHLINGQGRRANTSSPLAVVSVTKGKRYRFRLVSMACDAVYQFWIENHNLTVIEADGNLVQPLTVDSLTIYDAQRYSVVVTADKPVANYWIRIVPQGSPADFTNNINSAIFRYAGAPNANPTSSNSAPSGPNELVEADLHPLQNPGAPNGPNIQKFTLNIAINAANNFTINNVPFIPPSVPVLLQILNGQADPNKLLPVGSVFPVEKGQIVEVTIPGGSIGAPHPFHLHGHAFDVIRTANSTTTNLVNPPRRDVVNTGLAGDDVTFRFATDNPGPWILHCHIDWHLNLGLAIVFAERTSEVKATDHVNPAFGTLCPTFDPTGEAVI